MECSVWPAAASTAVVVVVVVLLPLPLTTEPLSLVRRVWTVGCARGRLRALDREVELFSLFSLLKISTGPLFSLLNQTATFSSVSTPESLFLILLLLILPFHPVLYSRLSFISSFASSPPPSGAA